MRLAPFALLASSLLLVAGCTPSTDSATTTPAPSDAASPATPATDATDTTETSTDGATLHAVFQCGDRKVDATFDNVAEAVTLSWPDGQLVLPQAISASGARYADNDGNEFWNKGREATLTVAGAAAVQCTSADAGNG